MFNAVYSHKGRPNSVYINLSQRGDCPNNCVFCSPAALEEAVGARLSLKAAPPIEDLEKGLNALILPRTKEIVFCGLGEPLTRLDDLLHVARFVKQEWPNKSLRLNTNGQAGSLHPERNVARELKEAGVESVNVSLNAVGEEQYKELCRPKNGGAFNSVAEFVRDCVGAGLQVRASFVCVPGLNEEECRRYAHSLGVNEVLFRPLLVAGARRRRGART